MGTRSQSRSGSMQFWPRKRIHATFPSVNWDALKQGNPEAKLLGFIGYKVGMTTCLVKDSTPNSLTKDKRVFMPATIIELPPMKILSTRFYKNNLVINEILSQNLDKELKHTIKLPKSPSTKKIEDIKDYDDVRILVYSIVKQTGLKKSPDIMEMGLNGKLEEKLNFIKEHLNKEIHASEVLKQGQMLDVRGLTKAKGLVGPVKRFGITLKQHKSEKGVRRPGSLGPWHPHFVIFRVPMSGQMGLFARVIYNLKVLGLGRINEKNINPDQGFMHYGKIKTDYIVVSGSVQGPQKRQVLLTMPLRSTRYHDKRKLELVKIVK